MDIALIMEALVLLLNKDVADPTLKEFVSVQLEKRIVEIRQANDRRS